MLKLLAAALVLALALPAVAADAAKAKKKPAPALTGEDLFKKLDANQNGKLGADEFYAQFTPAATKKNKTPASTKTRDESDKLFADLDADKNKSLSLEEFKGYIPQVPAAKKTPKKKAK